MRILMLRTTTNTRGEAVLKRSWWTIPDMRRGTETARKQVRRPPLHVLGQHTKQRQNLVQAARACTSFELDMVKCSHHRGR
jgi:hypothetical protein